MRNRTKTETLKLAKDLNTREIVHALWREYLGLYNEKYSKDPEKWLRNEISAAVEFGQALGQDHLIEGNRSSAIGQGGVTRSFMELLMGAYPTIAADQNPTEWVATDRLAALGNGQHDANRSLAFEIMKSGFWKFFNGIQLGDYANGALPAPDGVLKRNAEGLFLRHVGEWLNLNKPLTIGKDTLNLINELGHTHELDTAIKNDLHKPMTLGSGSLGSIDPATQIFTLDNIPASSIVNGSSVVFGALYNLAVASDNRLICSGEWRIPTLDDFFSGIREYIAYSGGALKEAGTEHFNAPNTGATNLYQFSAIGSGYRSELDGSFQQQKVSFYMLLIDPLGETNCRMILYYNSSDASHDNTTDSISKNIGASIRLLRNATEAELLLPDGLISATYTGNDLKTYPLTKVGPYIILACNLNETKYSNGDWITGFDGGVYTPISNEDWVSRGSSGEALMCYYGNIEDPGGIQRPLTVPTKISELTNDLGFAKLESPNFSGTPTVPTAESTTNSTQIASTAFVKAVIAELINGSSTTLDTLAEIATALGEDPDFATTMTNLIGTKLNASFDNISDQVAARTALGLGAVALLASIGISNVTGLADALAGKQPTMIAGTHYMTPESIAAAYAPISVLNDIETLLASI